MPSLAIYMQTGIILVWHSQEAMVHTYIITTKGTVKATVAMAQKIYRALFLRFYG